MSQSRGERVRYGIGATAPTCRPAVKRWGWQSHPSRSSMLGKFSNQLGLMVEALGSPGSSVNWQVLARSSCDVLPPNHSGSILCSLIVTDDDSVAVVSTNAPASPLPASRPHCCRSVLNLGIVSTWVESFLCGTVANDVEALLIGLIQSELVRIQSPRSDLHLHGMLLPGTAAKGNEVLIDRNFTQGSPNACTPSSRDGQ
mmetsp:Transcript_35088/g.82054  ORF Transcript_35088/g.82054 Transcript_35088/m.82054 type:complete len:200 (-) Transcript_35088:3372-3971(-)